MATFTASVALNMRWRHLPTGTIVEIAEDGRNGIPLPAGTEFTVPDAVADDFQADMEAGPDHEPPKRRWQSYTGSVWYGPGPLPVNGRIPGLERLD